MIERQFLYNVCLNQSLNDLNMLFKVCSFDSIRWDWNIIVVFTSPCNLDSNRKISIKINSKTT